MAESIVFPREPYDGQRRLAASIYNSCSTGTTSIYESPTGTGKSLAVLCGTLSWLEHQSADYNKLEERVKQLKQQQEDVSTDKTLANTDKFKRIHIIRDELDAAEDQLAQVREINKRINEPIEDAVANERRRYAQGRDENVPIDDTKDDIEELGKSVKKLIYVSRTHSQLTQFLQAMDNPVHRHARPVQLGSRASLCLNSNVNTLPNALVNCECARLVGNTTDIEDLGGEEVASASKKKSPKQDTCPYYNRGKIVELRRRIWQGALLTNHIKEEGEKIGACPFYAAKRALPLCNVVAMPYNVLFDAVTRDTYGVDVSQGVIVVDEAHNFLSTVYESASFSVRVEELEWARQALDNYLRVTKSTRQDKLDAARQISAGVGRLVTALKAKSGQQAFILKPSELRNNIWTADATDYLQLANLIEQNGLLHESRSIVARWWRDLHTPAPIPEPSSPPPTAANKLSALLSKVRESGTPEVAKPAPSGKKAASAKKAEGTKKAPIGKKRKADTPAAVANAKVAKTTQLAVAVKTEVPKLPVDGCLLFGKLCRLFRSVFADEKTSVFVYSPQDGQLRYLRLDIDSDLEHVIRATKAFLMVGGTMRPKGYIASALKTACSLSEVREEQFGHVIQARNILPLCIATDENNVPLTFKVSQLTPLVISRYVNVLVKILAHVPHGVVIFLPNYKVVAQFEERLNAAAAKAKPILAEKRGADSTDLMRRFTEATTKTRGGAALLASASGKLSEGINFSDNLARAVIMVGLPFPNAMEVETKLRAEYAVSQRLCSSVYEHLSQSCTRVVAQCMGRAIRHAHDFASLIFLDERYDTNGAVARSLPEWMTARLRTVATHDLPAALKAFYDPLMQISIGT